jgi:hypothetical protein
MKLDELGSSISENQFILHILNNMTADYNLQLAMMEKRINDKINLLTVDGIRADLNLRFERLNEKKDDSGNEDNQYKGKCRNCGMMGHKSVNCKNKIRQNGFQNGSQTNNQSGGQKRGNQVICTMALTALIVVGQAITGVNA